MTIKSGGVISTARAALGLSQAGFGAWLAEKTGREAPFSAQRICDWEHGRKSPRLNIRQVCAPIAVRATLHDILKREPHEEEIEKILTATR